MKYPFKSIRFVTSMVLYERFTKTDSNRESRQDWDSMYEYTFFDTYFYLFYVELVVIYLF